MAKSTSYTLRMTLRLNVRHFTSSNLVVFITFLFRLVKILFCQLQLYIFGRMSKDGTTTLSKSTLSIMTKLRI